MDVEKIIDYLRALYQDSNNEEAELFFRNMINSESDCLILHEILMKIIIEDNDTSLKNISVILIREMNADIILNSIMILNQKIKPEHYQIIEILTDYLAKKKNSQLIPLITDILSNQLDMLTRKAIAQLLNSINYLMKEGKIDSKEYETAWPIFYQYFIQSIESLISKNGLDENETIFLYYFLESFQRIIYSSMQYSKDFIHRLACFCLNQKISNNLFNRLIDIILIIYSKFLEFLRNEMPVTTFLYFYDQYCQSTHYIPEKSLYFWRPIFMYIDKFKELPDNMSYLIINYVFPFFKFNPSLINENMEQFLNEFSPDVYEIPLYSLIAALRILPYFPSLSTFIFQFSDSYFQQYINQNNLEICRILNFTTKFLCYPCPENQQYLCDFYIKKIIPMIIDINLMEITNTYLAISICEFIKSSPPENESPIYKDQDTLQVLINFVKYSILCPFEENNAYKLLFYFAVCAFEKKFKDLFELFNFSEEEKFEIFSRLFQLNTEIQTYSMNSLLKFLIKNMMPSQVDIQKFSKTLWSLCTSINGHVHSFLLGEYFSLLLSLFQKCDPELKQAFFNDIFDLLTNEMDENGYWIVNDCFISVLSLMEAFTCTLLDSSDELPFFMTTVGEFVKNMLYSVDTTKVPLDIINDSVFIYQDIAFEIMDYTPDPDTCLEIVMEPFLIPIMIKFNELLVDEKFAFDPLNSPLIKFQEDPRIFQSMWDFYQIVNQMESFEPESKSNFLTSLIISNPSVLIEAFDQDQILSVFNICFPQSTLYLHFLALRRILKILHLRLNEKIINIITESFTNRIEKEKLDLFNDKGEYVYECQIDDDNRLYFENHIFTEDFEIIMNEIKEILKQFGVLFE